MNAASQSNKKSKPIVAVRVTDVGLLPPRYFTEPIVIRALEDVLMDEVAYCGRKCPIGAQIVYGRFNKKHNILTKIERFFRKS